MIDLVFYCRAGYETDLLGELQDQLAAKQMYGYASFKKNDAMLRFHLNNESDQTNSKLKTENGKHNIISKHCSVEQHSAETRKFSVRSTKTICTDRY